MLWIAAAWAAPDVALRDDQSVDRPVATAHDEASLRRRLELPDAPVVEVWFSRARGPLLRRGELTVEAADDHLVVGSQTLPLRPTTDGWHQLAVTRSTLVLDGEPALSVAAGAGDWTVGGGRGRRAAVAAWADALPPSRLLHHHLVARGVIGPRPGPGQLPLTLHPQSGAGGILTVAYDPTGRLLAVRYDGPTLQVWDADAGRVLHQWGRGDTLHNTAWAPEGRRLAFGSCVESSDSGLCQQTGIDVVDVVTGETLHHLLAFSLGWVDRVRFSPDGTRLAATGDGTLKIWNLVDGSLEYVDEETLTTRVRNLVWDGPERLAAGGNRATAGGTVAVWEHGEEGWVRTHRQDVFEVREMAFVDHALVSIRGVAHRWTPEGQAEGPWPLVHLHVGPRALHGVTADRRLVRLDRGDLQALGPLYGEVWAPEGPFLPRTALSPDGTRLVAQTERGVQIVDPERGEQLHEVPLAHPERVRSLTWRPDGGRVVVGDSDGRLHFVDPVHGEVRRTLQRRLGRPERVAISEDGRDVAVWSSDAVRVFDVTGVRPPDRYDQPAPDDAYAYRWTDLAITETALTARDHDRRRVWRWRRGSGSLAELDYVEPEPVALDPFDARDGLGVLVDEGAMYWLEIDELSAEALDRAFETPRAELPRGPAFLPPDDDYVTAVAVAPGGREVAVAVARGFGGSGVAVEIYDRQGELQRVLDTIPLSVEALSWPAPDRLLAHHESVSGAAEAYVRIWDPRSGAVRFDTWSEGSGTDADWTPDLRRVVHGLADGRVVVHDLERDTRVTFVAAGSEWVMYGPDAVFLASENGSDLVAARQGDRAFAVDQLALTHNQPHTIIERLGGDARVADAYADRWAVRLRRAGLDPAAAVQAPDRPTTQLLAVSEPDEEGNVTVEVRAIGQQPLQRLMLWVQGVPVADVPLEAGPVEARHTFEVALTPGRSIIEVGARDRAGRESLRARAEVSRVGEASPRVWFLGFGVSDYADDRLDLSWAHADARALAAHFSAYRDATVHAFTDAHVTPGTIEGARQLLAGARPEDVVVLFVAGHGVYDDDGVYRYLPHDVDPEDVSGTGVAFEVFEELLYDVSARQKLFLMDTCNSGERDAPAPAVAPAGGDNVARGMRGLKLRRRAPQGPTVDRDRFVFADLRRRSGAIVLSSSSGTELSYESDALRQGQFTHAVLRGLRGEADRDGDGAVDTDELRWFVADEVRRNTGGAQTPRVDRDNLEQRIELPVPR